MIFKLKSSHKHHNQNTQSKPTTHTINKTEQFSSRFGQFLIVCQVVYISFMRALRHHAYVYIRQACIITYTYKLGLVATFS